MSAMPSGLPLESHRATSSYFPLATRVVISWALAGAVTAGGFFMALLTISNQLSPSHLWPIGPIFFMLGAGAGIVHGGLLGYLGRGPAKTRPEGMKAVLLGVLLAIAFLFVDAVLASWIALTTAGLQGQGTTRLAAHGLAWLLGAGICVWAVVEGWMALQNALGRWPESRVGTGLILAIFALALVSFLVQRPEIWGTDIRVHGLGAVILAVGATVWLAAPVVVAGLYVLQRWRDANGAVSMPAEP